MVFLRAIDWDNDGIAAGRFDSSPDGQAADLTRRGEVSLQQGRRQFPSGDVVEAVARIILRKQGRDIHFNRKQVADRVLVFGSIVATESLGAAGIGLGDGRTIE